MHHAITDFTLDIAQNSIEAGSSVITVDFIEREGMLTVCDQYLCHAEVVKA